MNRTNPTKVTEYVRNKQISDSYENKFHYRTRSKSILYKQSYGLEACYYFRLKEVVERPKVAREIKTLRLAIMELGDRRSATGRFIVSAGYDYRMDSESTQG